MRKQSITLTVGLSLLIIVIAVYCIFDFMFQRPIRQLESHLTDVESYLPASNALARMYQSGRPLFAAIDFRDLPSYVDRLPPELSRLCPESLEWRFDGIDVWFGGGFHHFQYELRLDSSACTATTNRWVLIFADEGRAIR